MLVNRMRESGSSYTVAICGNHFPCTGIHDVISGDVIVAAIRVMLNIKIFEPQA